MVSAAVVSEGFFNIYLQLVSVPSKRQSITHLHWVKKVLFLFLESIQSQSTTGTFLFLLIYTPALLDQTFCTSSKLTSISIPTLDDDCRCSASGFDVCCGREAIHGS